MARSKPNWSALVKQAGQQEISGEFWRIVESQSQVATTKLVDSLAEQSVLEELLETSKPPLMKGTEHLHYLLATPFRYPPLRWGSRFGERFEPSLLYGSLAVNTALSEAAYYRRLFWQGMQSPPPSNRLTTQHEVFSARYFCDPGLRLQKPPFKKHRNLISDKLSYKHSHELGRAMREASIYGFEFTSARCDSGGINIALFNPHSLIDNNPQNNQRWLCETTASAVRFRSTDTLLEFV